MEVLEVAVVVVHLYLDQIDLVEVGGLQIVLLDQLVDRDHPGDLVGVGAVEPHPNLEVLALSGHGLHCQKHHIDRAIHTGILDMVQMNLTLFCSHEVTIAKQDCLSLNFAQGKMINLTNQTTYSVSQMKQDGSYAVSLMRKVVC